MIMNKTEVIDKYIDGDLMGSELLEFDRLLSNDEDFAHDYNLSLEINNAILEEDVMALRETMDYMYKDENKVKRIPNVFAGHRKYYAAASIALLVAAGGLVKNMSTSNMDTQVLFETYYSPYEANITYRSGNSAIDKVLLEAMSKYEENDFEKASVLFEEVLQSDKGDMAVSLYAGISYLEEEKYQKASNSFNRIITDNDNLFIEQAKWYLSMCYIKTEKNNKAIDILEELVEENSAYKKQAKKVLRAL